MKKIIVLTISLFLLSIANAQLSRSKNTPENCCDSVWQNLKEQIKRTKTTNGDVLILQEAGKYKLYATYKDKQVLDYYAIDTKGNKIPAVYNTKGTQCVACIVIENGINHCYDIDCNDLPKQKPKTNAVKTAN